MGITDKNIDSSKRKTMKLIAGAALATGAAMSPLLASAGCGGSHAKVAASAIVDIPGTGVSISFVDDDSVAGARATITNTTGAPVALRHVYPGIVSTRNGTFDINSLLEKGPLNLQANSSVTVVMAARNKNISERVVPVANLAGTPIAIATPHKTLHGTRTVQTVRTLYT